MFVLISPPAFSEQKNGFVLDGSLIPPQQIVRGGPEKDGIPAIDEPVFVSAPDADFLHNSDRILGIEIDGIARAYPIGILNWHEVVNDSIAETDFAITYCPLCGTGMAFDSRINERSLNFGVSGLLYNSDVLLYDRESESLWSQILGKAVTGKYKGSSLRQIPLMHTTWSNWKRQYPATQVLSTATGFSRQYTRNPYQGYRDSVLTYFPVTHKAPARYHPKESVLGLTVGDSHKAYPFVELNKNNSSRFSDTFNGKTIVIHWNQAEQSGFVTDEHGAVIPVIQAYWFAWYAFHPDTMVFTSAAGTQ